MFRPPAREICLDALEDIYRTCKFHVCFSWPGANKRNRRRIASSSREDSCQMATAGSWTTAATTNKARSPAWEQHCRKWYKECNLVGEDCRARTANEFFRYPATKAGSWGSGELVGAFRSPYFLSGSSGGLNGPRSYMVDYWDLT
jgi:hypothetical protein